jgi:hypothetical protein
VECSTTTTAQQRETLDRISGHYGFLKDGIEPIGSTPEQFAAHIRSERAKWEKVVDPAGIKPSECPALSLGSKTQPRALVLTPV